MGFNGKRPSTMHVGANIGIEGLAGAVLLLASFSPELAEAGPKPDICSGVLTNSHGHFVITIEPEGVCIFGKEDEKKILAVCSEGHRCEVKGLVDDCEDSGECAKITNVTSVKDFTSAGQQSQSAQPLSSVAALEQVRTMANWDSRRLMQALNAEAIASPDARRGVTVVDPFTDPATEIPPAT